MKPAFKKILLVLAVLFVVLLYFFFDARKGMFPHCPFHSVTGFYCPGCGSQRALSALLHGDFLSALQYNILLILFLPLLLYAGYVSFKGQAQERMHLWYNPLFGKIVLIVVVSFWVLRNIPSHPFTILAPLK
jgi:hypothetical protein